MRSEQFQAEIEDKFGFLPPFFIPALQNPQVLENLWQQTLSAYVNNPLPALFKEKLSAYLSRYCAVPYCMICHSCSLHSLGMKAEEVLALLELPLLEEIEIDKHLHILAQAPDELILTLDLNPALEESLLYCAIFISKQKDSAYCRSELRRLLGTINYQHLVSFIAYVKTCHVWMEAHPEVVLEADQRVIDHLDALLEQEPGLADFFNSYIEKVSHECQTRAQVTAMLARQRLEALEKATDENLRLAKAVASVSDAVVITDPSQPDNPIVYANSGFEQMTGYLSSEVIGRNCRFLQGTTTDPQALAQIKQGIAAQREVKITLLNYRACGQPFWNELKISPIFSDSGNLLYFVGIGRDITERKQAEIAQLQAKVMEAAKLELEKEILERQRAEAALQETTTLQRAILNSANYAIVSTNLDGTILTFNAAAERWLGYTSIEVVGKTTPAILHDWNEVVRRAQELSQEIKTVIEPGFEVFVAKARRSQVEELEWTYIRKDGSCFPILLSVTALRDSEGNITGFLEIASDITERKQAQTALVQSEERFKAFMNNSPAVALMKDEQGRFVYINQPFERCFNIKMEDWLGKTDFDVWSEELALQFRENDRAVLAADKTLEVVEVVPDPDGNLRQWLSFKFPCHDISGQRLLGGIAIDITDRLQAQEALQQANDKLSRSVDELEQRQREFAQLRELSDFLQACKTVEEAYTALEQLVPALFPQTNGGIFLINDSKNLVEAVATWGSPLPSQELFAPDECWALRRGRTHHTTEAHSKLRCSHIHSDSLPTPSLCIPVMAQGKAMGVLYLSLQELGGSIKSKQHLAVTVADHIALALANLKLRETLQNQSIRDPLTGLFNRRYLEESLERELHRCDRAQQSLGIIMLDVDHFKSFNDTFGHSAGDAVLRELGQFLQSHIRKSDIACRYGGEELTLILPEASVEIVLERAQAIREGVKRLAVQHRRQLLGTISLSLGVAMFPEHGVTAEGVLRAADCALYRAKQSGRDQVIVSNQIALR